MAVTKKTSAKKITGKIKTLPKVKLLSKKTSAKKTRSKGVAPMRSFKLSRDDRPFMTTRITRQTVYWSALLIFIMIMQILILNIQLDVIAVTDSLSTDAQSSAVHSITTKAK